MDAKSVTLDFEVPLIQAVTQQFREAKTIFCFFHWKQAIRRKLIKSGIPFPMITRLMNPVGLINLLPMVPVPEIPKAIAYIRSVFDEGDYVVNFDVFWKYFLSTWCTRYNPGLYYSNFYNNLNI